MAPVVYVGTIGESIWRSADGGETWDRATEGLSPESDIRALAINPDDASTLFAGTEAGIYRTQDSGGHWQRCESAMNDLQIWSIAISGQEPDTIYAGTCPAALFKSADGGDTWKKLDVEMKQELEGIAVIPRVTSIAIDPEDGQTVYAGVEIDGMRVSHDGGESWTEGSDGLSSRDIHGLTVVAGDRKTLFAGTDNDVCITRDMQHWTPVNVKDHFPWSYCRNVLHIPTSKNRVYVGAGNGPPGDEGGLFYTTDLGASWDRADLGRDANSTIWAISHNAAIPDWIIAYSVKGEIYCSTDNGDSWAKLGRQFGEIRAVAIASP